MLEFELEASISKLDVIVTLWLLLKVSKSYLKWANSNNVQFIYITDAEK
jgi:hypothetical protein